MGKIVTAVIDIAKDGSAGSKTVCTLPEGWRPFRYMIAPAFVDGAIGYVEFASDGTVKANRYGKDGRFVTTVSYLTA